MAETFRLKLRPLWQRWFNAFRIYRRLGFSLYEAADWAWFVARSGSWTLR